MFSFYVPVPQETYTPGETTTKASWVTAAQTLSRCVALKKRQYKDKIFSNFLFSVTETTFSDVTARQEDQPCGVRVSSHTGMVN